MKTTAEFVSHLRSLGIKLSAEGDRLRCNAPKQVLTPSLKAELAERKTEILNLLRQAELAAKHTQKNIELVPRTGDLPLSFAQQRIWFFTQLEPESPAYNIASAIRVQGELNIEVLNASLNEIIRRHEILRTKFIAQNGLATQHILPDLKLSISIENLQLITASQREATIEHWIVQEAQHSFDLAQPPLLHARILDLGEQEYILLFVMHHIISDGWSINLLVQELIALYPAFANGKPSPLPELPIQYMDFAVWQREWLRGEQLKTQLEYWKHQLAGDLPILSLPTDHPRPSISSYRGARHPFLLSKTLSSALKTLSQEQGATLFMTLLAAFKVLLYRYTGQTDILIGSPIANRNRVEIENLIGFFVNTLVLRTNLSGEISFLELLEQVREVTLSAYAHQDLPFEKLVEELKPERDTSHNPLFQVMFILQNTQQTSLELPGLSLEPLDINNGAATFDLTLSFEETQLGLTGTIEYDTDLFDGETIRRMESHLQTLLASIVATPTKRLCDLPLLTTTEQQQLFNWSQGTVQIIPQDLCIHQLFEAQVERTPDAIALVFDDQRLTYRQLNNRANKIAHYLQQRGVKTDVVVGICTERSVEMVVGILAIIKAGGTYLPLDPAYPQERLTFMLQDGGASLLLTQQKLLENLPKQDIHTVCLDKDWEIIAQQSNANITSDVTSQNLAYVVYTSGSTGKSKGVMVTHQSLVNAYYSWEQAYQLHSLTSHLQMASFSFDVFSGDLIRAFCSGGKLVLCPREWLLDAEHLYHLMLKEKIDSAEFVPAVLKNLVEYLERTQQNLHFMRLLVVGSDNLNVQTYQQFQRFCGSQTRLINSYGVSEATIDSTYFADTKVNLSVDGLVPIGYPFANIQIYILDRYLQPVPIGIEGELHIGGAGLARGYLNRPELTAQKFIPHPYSQPPGVRLYKTGDLARYLPDGNIEFLGRMDDQVKIRGFRIELAEIEAALNQHHAVQDTVVIVREDQPGDKRLVAYVVSAQREQQSTSNSHDLRQFLKQKLPEYMVPTAFVFLAALPLTPNGKVNRKALPAPDTAREESQQTWKAPRTTYEEILASIWSEILHIKQVSIDDNFFDLGGHSLIATQLISRVRQVFQVELPLRCVFTEPTLEDLAAAISTYSQQKQKITLTPILPAAREQELPLSFAQQRLWFLDRLYPNNSSYNISEVVRLEGVLNIPALENSLNEIIKRHEILRTTFVEIEGKPIQVIRPQLQIKLPVIELQQLSQTEQAAELQRLIAQEVRQPFELATDPLVRVTVLRLQPSEHVVFFTMHHIISDAWSMEVLIRELTILYRAFLDNQPSPLPELPIQYADFAVWQQQWLVGEVLETQLAYWKKHLGGQVPVLQLPYDRPRAVTRTSPSMTYTFQLSTQLSQEIQQLSRESNATVFMTMLAAFKTLLYRCTGQDDIVVGTDVANRNRAETEGLIGFFVNLLVLRTSLSGYPSFQEVLHRVREVALGAYAHQDLPFEKLVEELQPERHLSQIPLFQVLFVMQNVPSHKLELPEINLVPLNIKEGTAKFDLALFIQETEQGIIGSWEYNADLFNATTIAQITDHFQMLLKSIVVQPDARINTLQMLTEAEQAKQIMTEVRQEENKLKKFLQVKPKSVKVKPEELIKTDYFQPGQTLPLILQPNIKDIDVIEWAKSNRQYIETQLLKHGAILFRGFNLVSASDFENLAQAICPDLFGEYGDLPREGIGGKVYGSTPYPANEAILFHNESSHMHCWPMRIWFFCVQPSQQGGETPIVDCRQVYQLLDPKFREKLEQKRLMYVRNYIEGLDVSWQDFFHTTDRVAVENYCRQAEIEWEWLANNGLRTRKLSLAVALHPKTGERVFFNQIQLHHISYLNSQVRESLFSLFEEDNLPRNVYYGDGSPLEDSLISGINQAYQQATISFSWQQGDVLMLDNMLTAHGRFPYRGQRKILVAMAEMISSKDIA